MNDYIDTIASTLASLAGKAKDIAAEAVESVDKNGTVRGFYANGAERAKSYARIAKLTLELNRENEELRKVYTEIGKLYYEQQRENPEGFFAPLFAQADETSHAIVSLEDEIEAIKAEVGVENPAESFDFDRVVSADEDENRGE